MNPALPCVLLSGLLLAGGCGDPELAGQDGTTPDDQGMVQQEARLGGKVGLSVIGLLSPHYDCDAVLGAFGRAPIVFGYLEHTFGEGRGCLERLLDHPKFAAVRVHIFNGPCVRDHRCGGYEVLAGETIDSLDRKLAAGDAALLARMRAEMERVRDRLLPHLRAGKHYYVSGILEHDVRDAGGARRVVDLAREIFSPHGFKIVNNPVSGATAVGADLIEGHGDRPPVSPPCVVDLDGTETGNFAGYANRYRRCSMVLGWNGPMNCLSAGEAWKDPRARTHCPTQGSLAPFARVLQTL